jgi:hypothetical protein
VSRRIATLIALVALAGAGTGAIGPTASPASAAAPIPTSTARLTGTFLLAGKVTAAVNVRGEHRGQSVYRHWTFTPGCASGACDTVTLVRDRAAGRDRLVLTRTGPGYYVGSSMFLRPLRCGAVIYRRGERVPFRITVRITLALISGGQAVASRIAASYRNQVRDNLTPCVANLGHDAASYHGHVVLPAS